MKGRRQTFHKLLWRSIRGGLSRFLSVFAIVALGCGFLVGLYSTCPDMQDTADDYYRAHHTMDLDVKATAGLTDADVEALRTLEGVAQVQAGYSIDAVLTDPEREEVTARLWAFPNAGENSLNDFTLQEGRLAERADECVMEIPNAFASAYQLGDVLTLPDENDTMRTKRFTVVGLAVSPLYMSIQQEPTTVGHGKVELVLYVLPDAFDLSVYTDALLTFSDMEAFNRFSEDYRTANREKLALTEALGEKQSEKRYEELQKQLSDALEQARAEFTAAEQEANERLAEAEQQLAELEARVADGKATLEAQLAELLALYGSEENFPPEVQSAVQDARAQISAGEGLLTSGRESLEESRTQAEEQLREGQEQLAALEETAQTLEIPRWVVRSLTDNASYESFYSNSEKLRSIAQIFPAFFCLVAALVAMTAMTRMVEEERGQIGTLGALGYGNGSILWHYLGYCLCACAPGCAVGLAVGSKLFPTVIANTYTIMYALPKLQTPLRVWYALGAFVAVCGVILLATALVCRKTLQETPAFRMRPRAPVAGKRILLERIRPLWKRLSFNGKVTARNIFRYKKRLLMTIVGVAGCTALLLTGFGLRDSVGCVVERQFDRVQTYDLTVMLRDGMLWEDDPVLSSFGDDAGMVSGMLHVRAQDVTAENDGERFELTLYVTDAQDNLSEYVSLHTHAGEQLPIGDGVVLTERAASLLNVQAGDTLTLCDADGKRAQVCVSGVCENYIRNFAFLSAEHYAQLFGEQAVSNCAFVKLQSDTPEQRDAVAARLYDAESVSYLSFSGNLRESFANMIERIDFVVYVLILSAALLAVIVLYNLNYINICERRRELATIKVLGFYEREVVSYVFRESNLLTLLGSLVGLGLGVLLHGFVIRTVEMDMVIFAHDIAAVSYVLAAVLTMLFSLLCGLLSLRTLRNIDMVDSLKANE